MTARTFDFAPSVSLVEAIRLISIALDDEGLALTVNDNGSASRITSVLVGGRKRVIVPGHRIVNRYGPGAGTRHLRLLKTDADVIENER
jgi:hypothetical protein